jgi:hypothetical protein
MILNVSAKVTLTERAAHIFHSFLDFSSSHLMVSLGICDLLCGRLTARKLFEPLGVYRTKERRHRRRLLLLGVDEACQSCSEPFILFLIRPLLLGHGEMQVGDLVGNNNNRRADLMFVQVHGSQISGSGYPPLPRNIKYLPSRGKRDAIVCEFSVYAIGHGVGIPVVTCPTSADAAESPQIFSKVRFRTSVTRDG